MLWVLFTLVLFFHIALEALDIRQSKVFLHGKDAFALAHILGQIPTMELNDLHLGKQGLAAIKLALLLLYPTKLIHTCTWIRWLSFL